MPVWTGPFGSDDMDVLGGKPTPDKGGQNYSRRTSLPATDKRRNFSAGSVKEDWTVDCPPTPVAELGPMHQRIDSRGDVGFSSSSTGILGRATKPHKA